jgi:hypothetical protein
LRLVTVVWKEGVHRSGKGNCPQNSAEVMLMSHITF